MDPAPPLPGSNGEPQPTAALAYYSAEDLAVMPPEERALVDRLAAPGYDALAAGDCSRCGVGPRVVRDLCLDCAPRLVTAT